MEKIKNCLYIVATPIGNLNELSPRALNILSSVSLIACEDTRETVKLLSHFNISKPLVSCHEHNENFSSDKLIRTILDGGSVAMVSDAGYPGISDPGGILIKKAIENEIDVHVISGPCAIINALIGSGLDSSHFYFPGFLNSKNKVKKQEMLELSKRKETIILYESPHRIGDTLEQLFEVFGDRKACVARELTKLYEEFDRNTLSNLANKYKDGAKGEIVLVIEGNNEEEVDFVDNFEMIKEVESLIASGFSTKDAIKIVSTKYNVSKNDLYREFHQ